MNIKITSKDFELTPAIEDYASKKISYLEKFLTKKEETICEVELARTTKHHKSGDNIYKAEINIVEPGSDQVYVVAEESDLYAAIDISQSEAERVMVSKKSKRMRIFRKGDALLKNLLKRLPFRRNS